jgi:hypothetical protein
LGSNLEARARHIADYTDRAGAEALKARIEAFWQERGYAIQVTLVMAAFTPTLRSARFDVRSELVNGLPRKCCARGSGFAKAA